MEVLKKLFCLIVCCLFFSVRLASAETAADSISMAEQEIKAGLLYNFLKYTDWPKPTSAVTVCMFGDDPFDKYIQPMAGRTVNQQKIILRKVRSASDIGTCQLLFVSALEKERWMQLRSSLKDRNVLTVSDYSGFADAGGMIEFTRKNNHISVNLNMDTVTAAGLHVQDRLLKLVTVVHSTSKSEGR